MPTESQSPPCRTRAPQRGPRRRPSTAAAAMGTAEDDMSARARAHIHPRARSLFLHARGGDASVAPSHAHAHGGTHSGGTTIQTLQRGERVAHTSNKARRRAHHHRRGQGTHDQLSHAHERKKSNRLCHPRSRDKYKYKCKQKYDTARRRRPHDGGHADPALRAQQRSLTPAHGTDMTDAIRWAIAAAPPLTTRKTTDPRTHHQTTRCERGAQLAAQATANESDRGSREGAGDGPELVFF